MTITGSAREQPFAPPPAPDGSRYLLFQRDVFALLARRRTEGMRAAGIDAYWEESRQPIGVWAVAGTYEWLCNVYVWTW